MVVECDVETLEYVVGLGCLYVGWKRCKVVEHFDIIRCYRCSAYGHLAKSCSSPQVCSKCSGSHRLSDCTQTEEKCINCFNSNTRHRTEYDTRHAAKASTCPIYQKVVDAVKRTTLRPES